MSNETAPAQKQDIDRVVRLLQAILAELRTLNGQATPSPQQEEPTR